VFKKKRSLHLETSRSETRLTIVGLCGTFILKPPTTEYPKMPENEDAVMHLANFFGIECVPHALIRLRSGALAYIARRIDLTKAWKIFSIEDFCQMDGRLTEDTAWLNHLDRFEPPLFYFNSSNRNVYVLFVRSVVFISP